MFYYANDAKLEIDFMIQREGRAVPIETQTKENLRSKSLSTFAAAHPGTKAVRLSMADFRDQGWMVNLPLYGIKELGARD